MAGEQPGQFDYFDFTVPATGERWHLYSYGDAYYLDAGDRHASAGGAPFNVYTSGTPIPDQHVDFGALYQEAIGLAHGLGITIL